MGHMKIFSANNWVIKLFPNARDLPFRAPCLANGVSRIPGFTSFNPRMTKSALLNLFMKFQLFIMRKIVPPSESLIPTLVFPDDFEKEWYVNHEFSQVVARPFRFSKSPALARKNANGGLYPMKGICIRSEIFTKRADV